MKKLDLTKYGITGTTEIVYNPSFEELFAEETKPGLEGYEKGQVSELGAVNVMTGIYTGRSPKDKFIVMDETSKDTVWWTSEGYKNDNHPAPKRPGRPARTSPSRSCPISACSSWTPSAAPTRTPAWPSASSWKSPGRPHFEEHVIRPTEEELENFEPDFVVFNASKAKVENYKELGPQL